MIEGKRLMKGLTKLRKELEVLEWMNDITGIAWAMMDPSGDLAMYHTVRWKHDDTVKLGIQGSAFTFNTGICEETGVCEVSYQSHSASGSERFSYDSEGSNRHDVLMKEMEGALSEFAGLLKSDGVPRNVDARIPLSPDSSFDRRSLALAMREMIQVYERTGIRLTPKKRNQHDLDVGEVIIEENATRVGVRKDGIVEQVRVPGQRGESLLPAIEQAVSRLGEQADLPGLLDDEPTRKVALAKMEARGILGAIDEVLGEQ